MKITLDLNEDDIKILHNAIAVFGNECSAAYLGTYSWYREKMREKYPKMNPFDLDDLIMDQAKRAKEISLMIDEHENQIKI